MGLDSWHWRCSFDVDVEAICLLRLGLVTQQIYG